MSIADVGHIVPLNVLRAGETAFVADVLGHPEQVHRLRELGFHEGASLTVVRSGSPCILRLAGQTLCFRANELLSVHVRLGVGA